MNGHPASWRPVGTTWDIWWGPGETGRVHRVLVSLDITERVVREAVAGGFDLIVSHHPVMNCTWHPVQTLRTDDRQGRILMGLVTHDISAICMHTNLDAAEGGVNDILAQKLGLRDLKPLTDEKIGRVGTLKCEIPLVEFTHFVIKSLGCNGLRYTDCMPALSTAWRWGAAPAATISLRPLPSAAIPLLRPTCGITSFWITRS